MVNSGDVIRHKKFMDVACVVLSNHYSTFKVDWINTGFVDSYMMGVKQTIKIRNLKDWQICITPNDKCLRYATWRNL